jgi:hypothetical protein
VPINVNPLKLHTMVLITMAEETERHVNEETHDFEDEEQGKISNEPFESGIREPQTPVVDDQQVNVLPENEEEEKEEILLTTASEASAPKAKSSPGKRQPNEIGSADIGKHLKRQTERLSKVTIMVQSIQKDFKSTVGQIKLIKQTQSQLKQLQNQLTQIQKFISKKDFAIKTTRSRKKTINANRSRKKR